MDFQPIPQTFMDFVYVTPFDSGQVLLWLPACATAFSASILLLHYVFSLKPVSKFFARLGILDQKPKILVPGICTGLILWLRAARAIGCLGLLVLSGFPFNDGPLEVILRCTPYLYTSALALLSTSPQNTRHGLIRHANCILFLVFCVYVYRDLVPLLTFTGVPVDLGEGRRLWAKIVLLFVTGIIIPLFTPQQYIPVDPLNPQAVVNPEQTASIFSFAFYFFLDRIILLAYRESHLQEEELYPLCDTDAAAHLQKRSFKYMDIFSGSKARRHLFFGLMRIFYREFIILALLLVFRVLTNYSGPYAMNQLLLYIETRDDPSAHIIVRPWVWIGLIFLGPIAGSFAFQTYIFINTRTLVRIEAIITQLVFAHSLRIRMKAETTHVKDTSSDVAPPAVEVSPQTGSDTQSTAETTTPENAGSSARSEDDSGSTTMQASSSSIQSTSTASKPAVEKPKKSEEKSGGSLVGKINNLVTVDLGNITDSRDFLILLVSVPLQLALGIYFLHVLLGWAVWVGVTSILLLAPVPGYMANLVRKVQKTRLKRTDERVQSVTEAVNVLRMIKLFGWEEKMKTRIGDKRNEELVWIRKRRFIDLVSVLVNFLIPIVTMTFTYAT
ncbi:ABC transporter transmembrane region-domain-containing protein [Mycena sanguinolenta]|nr:ABC transporter transmembrane region-domain-containing protein [Mycena sanguinolenta]